MFCSCYYCCCRRRKKSENFRCESVFAPQSLVVYLLFQPQGKLVANRNRFSKILFPFYFVSVVLKTQILSTNYPYIGLGSNGWNRKPKLLNCFSNTLHLSHNQPDMQYVFIVFFSFFFLLVERHTNTYNIQHTYNLHSYTNFVH